MAPNRHRNRNNELTHLLEETAKTDSEYDKTSLMKRIKVSQPGYDQIGDIYMNSREKQEKDIHLWKSTALVAIVLLVGLCFAVGFGSGGHDSFDPDRWTSRAKCMFCDQSPPMVHDDRSYTFSIPILDDPDGLREDVVVTPVTITYDYELYDGQMLYTSPRAERIPNLEFDYAILEVSTVRNLHRDTLTPVSLDEVYLHHLNILPLNMIGAEVLSRDESLPHTRFPDGYAFHVRAEDTEYIRTNAHLLSNKNLSPVGGSLARARKECNECYYAPGKGAECTPETSGTFRCCGDSPSCIIGREDCRCATTSDEASEPNQKVPTKYRIEIDLLIARDIDKFQRIDNWNFAAPRCVVNLNGDAVFDAYPSDSYCGSSTTKMDFLVSGGGSLFHNVLENNKEPYQKTAISVVAPTGGVLVFGQSHLHTGGVNETLRLNGEVLCVSETLYGTDPDPATNARNEKNHLVQLSSCYDQIPEKGIRFERGDVFTTESVYYAGIDDPRFDGQDAAGEHRNVMSIFVVAVAFDGDSDYLTRNRTSSNLWNDFLPIADVPRAQRLGWNFGTPTRKQAGQ
mmetsp:Transcript_34637/g.81666  ORF Transcript_34637/g.81666 Transcript_34637/m.81666 type:complete len:568 (+) Transcript_34637:215-1918(+)